MVIQENRPASCVVYIYLRVTAQRKYQSVPVSIGVALPAKIGHLYDSKGGYLMIPKAVT
jgi:hypothetical protein